MSRLFLAFLILCVVAIFITAIPIAKYLSSQYFELRKELNSHDALKYSSRGKSGSASAKLESQNINPFPHGDIKKIETPELHTIYPPIIVKPLKVPKKTKRRSKRRAREENEILSWQFNLTVKRYPNRTSVEKHVMDSSLEKNIDVSLHAQGKAETQTSLEELQSFIKYVQRFLKSFFSNTTEGDASEKFEMKQSPLMHIKNGSSATEFDAVHQNVVIEFGAENNETSSQKGRKPKFILGLFGFGNRPEKTTQSPEKETTQLSKQEATPLPEQETTNLPEEFIISTVNENAIGFRKNEELTENISVNTEFVTKDEQEETFQSDSLVSETSTLLEGTDMFQMKFKGLTEQNNCSDCTIEETEIPGQNNGVSETVLTTEFLFADEVLEKFCMSLVNKLEESQPEDDFDPELNPPNESNQLRSSKNLSILGVVELFNAIKENETTPDSAVIEDAFLVSNTTAFQAPTESQRQKRFLGFSMFGFGSGRSAIVEDKSEDSVSEEFNEDINMENLPSILDCENYFRKKQSMFPKPNLMDMMSDPKIQLKDFANATVSPKLIEQQLQFLTGLLKTSLNNTIDTFDNRGEENVDTAEHTSAVKNQFLGENSEILAEKETLLNGNNFTNTSSENELNETTQTQRDARFFSVFGFGSGNSEDSRSGSDSFDSFGSGERLLETDTATKLERSGEFGSGEAFQANTDLFSEDLLEHSTAVEERQFLGLFGFGVEGSGDGRELSETVEIFPNEFTSCNESDCMDDCSDEVPCNSVEPPEDCNDCYSENFQINISEFTNFSNKSECNDCDEIIHDDKFVEQSWSSVNETKSDENHMNDCDDCVYDNDALSTKTIESDREKLFDCDHCNSSVTDASVKEYQSEEISGMANGTETARFHGNDCDDCDYENDIKVKTPDIDNEMSFSECDECHFNASVQDNESTNETYSDGKIDLECDDCNADIIGLPEEFLLSSVNITEEKISDTESLDEIQNQLDLQTTEKIPRFIGPLETIFLTGSGDGNLFEDHGGPINLVEEEFTIAAPVFPRRRGARLDDITEDPCDDCNVDFSELFGNNPRELEQIRPSEDNSPKRSGTVEETERSVIPEVSPISIQTFSEASTTEVQPQYCTSASQCNSALNERCITVGSSSICGCAKAYIRHKESKRCVVKRVAETSLKLPAEKFDEDLKNHFSERYKQMEKKANDMIWLALRDNPKLLSIIAEVELAGFSEGSLIVMWNLVFAVETNSEAQTIKDVEKDLERALNDKELMQKSPLDISNATVLAYTSEINPCSSRELNYCSEHAYCVVNTAVPARFVCHCKEHYRDASTNPLFYGETCIETCPPNYCGPNGHCEVLENSTRHCICNGLFFGRRCEVPGILVLSILAVLAFGSIIVAFTVGCRKRCTTVSYGGGQEFRRSEEVGIRTNMNNRVSDTIALEENIGSKITKFANISTPTPSVPAIRITRPTSHESSISFDGDSTFDSTNMNRATPTNLKKSENNSTV